jgi:hypothetical protein
MRAKFGPAWIVGRMGCGTGVVGDEQGCARIVGKQGRSARGVCPEALVGVGTGDDNALAPKSIPEEKQDRGHL